MAGLSGAALAEDGLAAPFPWMGGKRRVAGIVWERLGSNVANYVEPFFGSGAVLLNRPGGECGIETVNDADGLLCNAWRGVRQHPAAMAEYAGYLAHECDLHARHAYLVGARDVLTRRLEGDPEYCDLKLAGWWLWGIALWIGSGWCSGVGSWQVVETDTGRQLLHLGDAGQGVNRKRLHLGNAGQGVNRKLLHLGDAGREGLRGYMAALAGRLSRVRVCCGDWKRVCGPTPTVRQGTTAVFLDPPYSERAERSADVYAVDSDVVACEVRDWCWQHGGDRRLRIALCGYEGEGHEALEEVGWRPVAWSAGGGSGAGRGGQGEANRHRERIWFSPHCLLGSQKVMEWDAGEATDE